MRRILFIHHGKFPGGAEKSLYDVIKGLSQKSEMECHFIGPDGYLSKKTANITNVKTTCIIRFKLSYNPVTLTRYAVSWLISSCQILKYCRTNNIDIVYTNSVSALIYSWLAVVLCHSTVILHLRDRLKHPFEKWLIKKYCHKVISVSEFIDNQLSFLKPHKHCVIHNGIDPDLFIKKSGTFTKTVGYAGQIIPWKRIDVLIKAMKNVTEQHSDAKLIVTGNDWYNDNPEYHLKINAMIHELGLEKNVVFKEWHEDIKSFFAQIDILVLPSEREPFGRILIEAMSAGILVIGVNSGAIPEIITHKNTGLLCKNSPDDMAKKILRLFRYDNLRGPLRESAIQKVKVNFDIKNTVDRIQKEIKKTTCA